MGLSTSKVMSTELLDIQPQELKFTIVVKKQSSCSVRLGNNSDQYVAFKVKTTSPKKYCVRPNTGIIKPKMTFDVTVTMQAHHAVPPDMQCKDKFLIQSTVIPFGLTAKDITSDMFAKDSGKCIAEKRLRVILTAPPPSPILLPINGVLKQDPSCEASMLKDIVRSGVENIPPPQRVDEDVKGIETAEEMDELRAVDFVDSRPADNVEELKVVKKDVELNLAKDFEDLKLKLNVTDSTLREAEFTIMKLTEERRMTNLEKDRIKHELSMDSDSIERLQRVSLTAEEDEVIMARSKYRAGQTLEEWSLSLLGTFHTTELIDFRAAKNHLLSAWKMGRNDLEITDVVDGLFRFKFSMESQLKWVINNGPWSFDNYILLLRRWEKGMTAFSVNFQTVPMWVQVWGLPFDLIIKEAGINIGQGIGRVIEVDCNAIASGEARFLRVRVDVPLDKPIRGGAPVLSPEGDKVWVAFKYERLSGLCFHCGLLGHEAKACEFTKLKVWEESPYGEWLRATEDVPPQTSDSLVAQSHRDGNPNGHSYHSRTIIEEEIPEVVQCTELKGLHINEEQYWVSNDGKNPEINAIPALQNDMHGKSSSWLELKWLQQKLDCFDPKLLPSQGIRWLCDAFRLLLTNLSVKRLVVSLASGVILRNMSVQEFQWTPYAVNYVRPLISNEEPGISNEDPGFSNEEPGWATRILMWIWDGAKAIFEHIEKVLSQVKGLFQPPMSNNPTEGNKEQMEEKIRSSLPHSVVILLIEVVARALPALITIA